ncbi:DNA replication and repair protein RecN [Bacteroides faecichinchillae]|uniref:DNA repair protein RecN n=1 Tax=Bacteroides faecichinchillae TaxID=871325 RepID=A0A1M5EWQ6_9BACE|nr:DNA repair protein RecN [Bacteroides faecichinchillae]THG69242.1 DNA repair protein RecN [Bacteroides faecichinchillae]SHF83482.1 DNA replication and repair protein RecN [Bacteroides faecichinchillae]
MLRSLYIQNYALIEKLDISFETGFSVITGETGAGKSIILGAIGLLLGQRADVKAIRQGASKCIIEARFDISAYNMRPFFEENELEYDTECILRREVQSSGKSRAFINDTPASLVQVKELGEQLIDVHSQHQNLLLNKEGFQLNVLDILAHNDVALEEYYSLYNEWRQIEHELSELVTLAEQSRADEDYIRFQLEQLEEAHLSEGEQEELEQEAETLSHAEDIKAGLYRVEQVFASDEGGLLSYLKDSLNTLNNLQKVYQPAGELAQRVESTYIELKDISQEVSSQGESVEFNPARLDEVNDRLNLIYSLQQKHRVQTVEELITLTNEYRNRLSTITSYDERIAELTIRKEAQFKKVKKQAEVLTKARATAAREVEKQLAARLIPLGMPNVRFQVEMGLKKEPGMQGEDTVNFLFSANKNGMLQSISSVASGGEIARVMLSIKAMIAGAVKLPTIVFDEIDTGVSGEIADRMADMMQEMGDSNRQVISITHLPQIAARGRAHYKVYKKDSDTETNSHIRRLTNEERVEEIAHMLSGATLTEAALSNAKSLLTRN